MRSSGLARHEAAPRATSQAASEGSTSDTRETGFALDTHQPLKRTKTKTMMEILHKKMEKDTPEPKECLTRNSSWLWVQYFHTGTGLAHGLARAPSSRLVLFSGIQQTSSSPAEEPAWWAP